MDAELLTNAAIGIAIITGLVGAWRYRRLTPALRFIALLAVFDAVLELVSMLLHDLLIPNLFLFPVAFIGETLLLTLAYRQALASATLNRVLLVALGVYVAYLLVETMLRLGTVQYFATAQIVNNLFLLGLAALYFRKLLDELHVERLARDSFFYISVGLVVYALGNILIALSSDYLRAHYSIQLQRMVLHGARGLFLIVQYASYLIALWMRPPKPSFSSY